MRITRIVLLLLFVPLVWGQARKDAKDSFDHIILGTPDLDAGIRWMEQRTGVRAIFGGSHPGRGTRNALLSLGPRHYLEIMAPDPAQNVPDERGLKKLAEPRLIGWVVGTDNVEEIRRAAEAAGIKTTGPNPGSRERPDGRLLRWQMLTIDTSLPLAPGFIQWAAGSVHPSQDAPRAGAVEALTFEMPQPDQFRGLLGSLGINTRPRRSKDPRIVLTLRTPKGQITLR